jgi:predicted small secreted protein
MKSKRMIVMMVCVLMAFSMMGCNKAAGQGEQVTEMESSNPFVSYTDLDQAKEAAGFEGKELINLPEGYSFASAQVISEELIQITYTADDREIMYRTGKGVADISGDYNEYAEHETFEIAGNQISTGSNDENIFVATWTENEMSYAITASEGLDQGALCGMLGKVEV